MVMSAQSILCEKCIPEDFADSLAWPGLPEPAWLTSAWAGLAWLSVACHPPCSFCILEPADLSYRRRPYRVECTGSLPTSEVKRRRVRLVLGWGTAREELRVLSAFQNSLRSLIKVRRRALRRPPHLKGKEMRFA